MMERNYDTSIDTYTPTMMGFELPYGLRWKRSRQVIDIIRTAVRRIILMINPTTDELQAMFAIVFAKMAHYVVPVNATAAHFVVCMVSLWRGEVVSTSAGASRSVSSEACSF